MSEVSVIIPTFNRAPVLMRALNSVLGQSFTDWELIVVDDGSSDGTEALMREWMNGGLENIRYFKTENRGVSHARNFGVKQAHSPWVAFLDSDDEWLPRKLELQLALAGQFELIHGEEIWMRGGVRVNPLKKHAKSGGDVFARCIEICCISPSTTMLKRSLFERMNGFREDFPACEDYELWLRITRDQDVGFVSEPVQIKYGGNPDQLSLSTKAMDYYRAKALVQFLDGREARLVAETLMKKCEILARGFLKYPNTERMREIEEWRLAAVGSCSALSSDRFSARAEIIAPRVRSGPAPRHHRFRRFSK
jgi:glycosyltransferase involved in cell wall biosynthesis